MALLVIRGADPDNPPASKREALEAAFSLKTGDIAKAREGYSHLRNHRPSKSRYACKLRRVQAGRNADHRDDLNRDVGDSVGE
jgi:hypothetical protein